MNAMDMWNLRTQDDWGSTDLVGYKVEATDGHIGKVDETSNDMDARYLVVDTGPWIFGRKVLIPAGLVTRVDGDEEQVHLDLTKDQIKDSPELHDDTFREREYRDSVGGYYTGIII